MFSGRQYRGNDISNSSKRIKYTKTAFNFKHLSTELKSKVEHQFEKSTKYISCTNSNVEKVIESLNTVNTPWKLDELKRTKDELNSLKCQLSDKDIVAWQKHTNRTNISGRIVSELNKKIQPELCTQAWAKFYEIMSSYDILPLSIDFRSVHLCEAPGAFVTSLNHFLVSNGAGRGWSWSACTLNPYHEGNDPSACIMDDRFLRYTLDNWVFGHGDTGDVLSSSDMVTGLTQRAGGGAVLLVTADGSIDCQSSPAEQEVIVSLLVECEAAAALELLAPGGSLVLKLFTMFEASTVCLMYLLTLLFHEVNVFKPVTSKAGNSEVYVICTGYQDLPTLSAAAIRRLRDLHGSTECRCLLGRDDIPSAFMRDHIRCAMLFTGYQMDAIKENIRLYETDCGEELSGLESLRAYCAHHYFLRYNLQPISAEDKLVHGKPIKSRMDVVCMSTKKTGSYQDREDLTRLHRGERMRTRERMLVNDESCTYSLESTGEAPGITSHTGRPIRRILSSQFVNNGVLQMLHGIIADTDQNLKRVRKESDESDQSEADALLRAVSLVSVGDQSVTVYHEGCDSPLRESCKRVPDKLSMVALIGNWAQLGPSSVIYLNLAEEQEPECLMEEAATSYKIRLVETLLRLENLTPGQHVILRLHPALTRFSASFINSLLHLFKQVHLIPSASPAHHGFTAACMARTSQLTGAHDTLDEIVSSLRDTQTDETTVLCFVPITRMLDDASFTDTLRGGNCHLLQLIYNQRLDLYKQANS